jgi:hypothetical protein
VFDVARYRLGCSCLDMSLLRPAVELLRVIDVIQSVLGRSGM